MKEPIVFDREYRFCQILWKNEPIRSTELVRLCKEQLNWSKSTTYTVIRRLVESGLIKNDNAVVQSILSQEQVQDALLKEFVEDYFEGSLSQLYAATLRLRNFPPEKDKRQMYQRRGKSGVGEQHDL